MCNTWLQRRPNKLSKVFIHLDLSYGFNLFLDRLASGAVAIQKVFRGWQARSLYSKLKRITVIQENIVKNFLETVSVGYKYNQLISAFQFSLIAQFIPKRSNCRIPCHYCSGLYLRTYFCAGINYLKWQGILQLSHIFHICLQLSSSFSRKQRKNPEIFATFLGR